MFCNDVLVAQENQLCVEINKSCPEDVFFSIQLTVSTEVQNLFQESETKKCGVTFS